MPSYRKIGGISVIILGRAIGANLSPMAHENMTYGPLWPLKILDGANLYLNLRPPPPKKKKIDTSRVILRETLGDKYPDGFVRTRLKNIRLCINVMH